MLFVMRQSICRYVIVMDKEAFKNSIFSLADRLYPMIFRMLRDESSTKDAIQDIMLKLWSKRDRLTDHPNQSGFVFLTARNHCYDILKKKNKVTQEILESHGMVEQAENIELIELVREIISSCPITHKEVLLLRDIDGLEYHEIESITGLTIGHIRVVISRLRNYVQKQLTEKYHYEQ